jgi:hypothetical protein
MSPNKLIPALIIPFIAWRVYSRVRRNIGRQPFRPGRLKTSIGIFSTITLLFAYGSLAWLPVLGALGGGLLLSVPLAWFGVNLTKFETTPEGKFYTPNTALGVAVTVLFVGRIAYRFLVLFAAPDLQAPPTPQPFQSPLTFFLFGLTAGYYIAYYSGVLIRSHRPAA